MSDLEKLGEIMKSKLFSADEMLEIMSYLIAVKENIELLEICYSKL